MSAWDILYRCPLCASVRRQVDGKGPFSLELGQRGCAVCETWAAESLNAGTVEKVSHPSTPTCCNQPMQPSTSPYRWDTGELIKGKLLVCRECGEYLEANANSASQPELDALPVASGEYLDRIADRLFGIKRKWTATAFGPAPCETDEAFRARLMTELGGRPR